jgi:prolyl-tRNA editing enzyme YbaK/EbsC (Cys-tRNA(Pro) deacylase)
VLFARHSNLKVKMLTTDELESYCCEHQFDAKLMRLAEPTPTVAAAAEVMGCPVDQIVKSILFLIDEEPVLVIACGTARVDRRALARHYNLSKKRVRLASADQVAEYTGYVAGGLPPFGHLHLLPTLIDRRVLAQPTVYAGGGSEMALLRLEPALLLRVVPAIVLDLVEGG